MSDYTELAIRFQNKWRDEVARLGPLKYAEHQIEILTRLAVELVQSAELQWENDAKSEALSDDQMITEEVAMDIIASCMPAEVSVDLKDGQASAGVVPDWVVGCIRNVVARQNAYNARRVAGLLDVLRSVALGTYYNNTDLDRMHTILLAKNAAKALAQFSIPTTVPHFRIITDPKAEVAEQDRLFEKNKTEREDNADG